MSLAAARTLLLVKRAQTACRTGLDQALGEFDITPGKYTVLSLLASTKLQSSADVARQAGVSPQSMGELINQLEQQGMIERFENPEHRRMLMISLTREGQLLLDKCERRVDELEIALLEGLTRDEIDTLRKATQAIIHNSRDLAKR